MSATSDSQARRLRPQVLAGIAAILILILAVGIAVWRVTVKAANKPVNLSSLYWITYKEDLNRMYAADPGIMKQLLAGPGTYVYEQSAGGPPLPAGAIPVQLFFSDASFQAAITNHAILPGVTWVADDPEEWAQTPVAEQQHPLTYMNKFASTAGAQGLKTIMVPGRDLMQVPGAVCGQKPGTTISQAYLSCGLPRAAGFPSVAVYVIQAASVELDQTALVSLVRQAAAQARQANPNAIVIATLSTTPFGSPVGYTALNQAARWILPYVQGFEINSTATTDSRMIAFLHALASGS